MKTIHKYAIDPRSGGEHKVEMPDGSKILSIHRQGDHVCLWALVDDEAPFVQRSIYFAGTGHYMRGDKNMVFLGTAHLMQGQFVVHVFELLEKDDA